MHFSKTRWQDWASLIGGLWAASSVLWTENTGNAVAFNLIFGLILAAVALFNLAAKRTVLGPILMFLAGSALFFAPYLGDYIFPVGAAWCAFLPGFFAAFLSVFTYIDARKRDAFTKYQRSIAA